MWGSLKNLILGGFMKNQKKKGGGGCLKRKAWAACRFKGGLDKKERGGVFEGGDSYPNVHCNTHHDMT